MRASLPFAALLALLLVPDLAWAQGGCTLREAPGGTFRGVGLGTPQEMVYIRRPVFNCPNDMRITADSAVYTRMLNEIQFVGQVRFHNPQRELDADFARYLTQQRQLVAQGNVVLRDSENGSTIQAPTLDYLMESSVRTESRIDVHSGRPRTTLIRAASDPLAPPDTTVVDSDALSIIGEHTFIGRGNVVMRQGEMHGAGDLLEYAQESGTMRLTGSARLTGEDYRLAGHEILALVERDTLRSVDARGAARLETDDATVEAPAIHVVFEDGEVQRLVALGAARAAALDNARPRMPERAVPTVPGRAVPIVPQRAPDRPATVATAQAQVTSREFRMLADSIDALAPGQQLERVFAVGDAFAERLPADSADLVRAEALPDLIARDWVRGDTIIARFVGRTVPLPEPDTEAAAETAERTLESLVVYAGEQLASSAYRRRDENQADTPSVNYVLARQIRVTLDNGEVTTVEATGEVQGVYLSPLAGPSSGAGQQEERR